MHMYGSFDKENQYKEPFWFNRDLEKCECDSDVEIIYESVGYSDWYFSRMKCTDCGREYCTETEG